MSIRRIRRRTVGKGRDVSLRIDIRKKLASFDLEVAFEVESETLGFLGASGCGKSMTLRCIAGVEEPDEGIIEVNGTTYFDSAAGIDLSPQKRKTALLFQSFQLFPHLTVVDNIAAGIGRDVGDSDRAAAVARQIRRFSLEGLEKRFPYRLSGGQQQRVALARMIAAQPGILMLDEPFSALDAHLKSELEQDLLALFESFEGSILYVSHDIDEAFRFCDRIAVVEEGHIREIAPKRDIVSDPQTLATIRLSGCKNTTEAQKAGDHEVFLPSFGVTVRCAQNVPDDVRFFGVRAFRIRRARHEGRNVFRVRVDRASDSRFERTVMVSFLDGAPISSGAADESERFAQTHLQWKVDKLATCEADVPCKGDELLIEIPEEFVYVVTR